jgi:methylmalonyl-CoA/ethylmalonyl-CoA epimerase
MPRGPEGGTIMEKMQQKLRHIAISVQDVAEAQKFFEDAFGMTKAGDAGRGVYMTDGTMNVALLDFKNDKIAGMDNDGPYYGLLHFGMWVDNLEQAAAQAIAAGATHVQGRPPVAPGRYYEVKYRNPQGLVFDLTASGWIGAVKEVKPVG